MQIRHLSALLVCASFFGVAACQPVGPTASISRKKTDLASPSPVTLQIEDDAKKGVASGVGPAKYTFIGPDGIQSMQTGSTPRELWAKMANGTELQLSSGSDISIEGLTYDPATNALTVRKFGTSASEPLRAGNEAYDRLVSYWQTLSAEQRQARMADLEAIKAVTPTAANLISEVVRVLAGIP